MNRFEEKYFKTIKDIYIYGLYKDISIFSFYWETTELLTSWHVYMKNLNLLSSRE
jgi:hypothetical protein